VESSKRTVIVADRLFVVRSDDSTHPTDLPSETTAKNTTAERTTAEDTTARSGHPPQAFQHATSPHILTSTLYNRQYYEEHRRTGLDYLTYGDWQRDYGRWFMESLNLRGRRVLDVGCACGSILRGLIEAGADAEGIDLSDYMIELGRRKWPDLSRRLHVADAADLSRFAKNRWDAIHSSQVAEHWLPDAVPTILKELARITVPQGVFFCALDTEELFARQGRTPDTEDPTHICIRPRAWWIEQLAQAGWQDATAEFEPVLRSHPLSYLRRYDWDWWVGKKQ
jgi:SAM-dependent methyltransferase